MARHMIDMLAMLGEKTRGNLTLEENRMLENSVTELRFRFVQISGQARSGNEGPADTSGAGPSGQGSAGQGSAG
jgi:hypothetical protein